MSNKINNLYEFGEFRIDTQERVLLQGEETIILAAKVFDTLELLIKNQGKILSKDEMMNKIWVDSFVEESNLSQNIYMLRKTLGKEFIETVPRRGYRFAKEVKQIENGSGFAEEENSDEIIIAKRTKTSAYLREEIFEDASSKTSSQTNTIPAEKAEKQSYKINKSYLGIAIGLLVTFLIGVLGVLLWQNIFAESNESILENVKFENLTDTGNTQDFAISPDGQFLAIIKKTGLDDNSIWIKDISTKKAIPIDISNKFVPQTLNFSPDGKFIYFLHRPSKAKGAEVYKTTRFGGDSEYLIGNIWSKFSVSPDGKKIAFYRYMSEKSQGQLIIYDLTEKKEHILLTKDFPESFERRSFPAWSADGTKIFSIIKPQKQAISKLYEIDAKTGKDKLLKTPKFRQFMSVVALPNGEDLVFTARERRKFPQIYKMKTTGGDFQRVTNDLNVYRNLSLSIDGKRLTALQKNTFSHIWFLPKALPQNAIQLTSGKNKRHGKHGIDILPDGRIVFTSLDDLNRDIWTVNPKDGSKQQFTKQFSDISERPLVSSEGQYIYFNSTKGKTYDINRVGINGGEIETIIKTKNGSELFPNTSPDGKTLYFIRRRKGNTAIFKKQLPNGKETEIKLSENFTVDSFLAISPDGKYLAFRQTDKQKPFEFEEEESNPIEVGIISLESNDFTPKTINIVTSQSQFRWNETSDAIYYIKNTPENSEIWKKEVFADTNPEKILELEDTKIFHFKFSDEGDLAVSKGKHLDDAILLTDFN